MKITVESILKAHLNIQNVVYKTATQYNPNISEVYNSNIYLKREDLQLVRSYKLRGAYNLMKSTPVEELNKGVVCASAGNHAQGVAYSCCSLKVKGTIFMPNTTPFQKVNQVRFFGKEYVDIQLVGDTFDDAYNEAQSFCEAHNMTFIHPFDDQKIIEGQGTVGVEILSDVSQPIDYLFVPIGGGGLASGVASYFQGLSPNTKIIGVEPEGAPSMKVSVEKGEVTRLSKIDKFVDGAAVQKVGENTFSICKEIFAKEGNEIITVPEGKICTQILKLYSEEAIVVEPAGALTVAALDSYKEEIKGKNIVCVVSGSNNDIGRMQEIRDRSLMYEGLKHYFIIRFPQRAGALREFVGKVLGPNDDITRFEYSKKSIKEAGPAFVGVELSQKEDYQVLIDKMESFGINYTEINKDPILYDYLI
ncbi:MAG: threonine ammonia-lyase IlvA [Cytophagales bacterium]|nr:threonine ammonia-lyase IlvA [Cytophagales bacterium]